RPPRDRAPASGRNCRARRRARALAARPHRLLLPPRIDPTPPPPPLSNVRGRREVPETVQGTLPRVRGCAGAGIQRCPQRRERSMTVQEAIRFLVHPPTSGPRATIALRLMAGAVFFWEGLLKFAYANQGVGRFTKLGMPMPEVLAP